MIYSYQKYSTDFSDLATVDSKTVDFPVIFDTEYQSPDYIHRVSDEKLSISGVEILCPATRRNRIPITAQIATIDDEIGKIYAYPELQKFAVENGLGTLRHEILDPDCFIPLEYLKTKTNINYLLSSDNKKTGKIFVVTVIGFFLTAEISLLGTGKYINELRRIINGKEIKTTKRLSTGNMYSDYASTKIVVYWNNVMYNVALRLIDLAAIHGVASYAEIAKNVGHELKFKDNFTKEDKGAMITTYFKKPNEFDNYALGDLDCYKIMQKNADMKKQIYRDLDIEDYYTAPKMTIGSEVSNLLEAVVMKQFNVTKTNFKKSDLYQKIIDIENVEKMSFTTLKKQFFKRYVLTNTGLLANRVDSGCFLAKVFGGRCYNNRNSERHIKSIMIDLDIAGCYGNGLKNQEYPFGDPKFVTFEFQDLNAKKRLKPLYLKEFLKVNKHELVDGLWTAVISTTDDLEYPQDFFQSWLDWKIIDHEIDVKSGITKIFQKRIYKGVITSDGLEFVDLVMSNKQREDFYRKTVVECAVFYPRSKRLNTLDELIQKPVDGGFWTSVNMGDLVINKLISERKKHAKKTPLNTLFKLMINTTYGDIVSPYFKISNALVGNNITARARALCYYMEKGLNGFQSITDGVCFEVEKVVLPSRRSCVNAIDLYSKKEIKHGKLFDADELIEKYLYLKNNPDLKDAKKSFDDNINQKCWDHLKTIFHPEITIFKKEQFMFEYKDIIKEATFMGSSDYKFKFLDGTEKIKKRSYSERKMKYEITKVEKNWLRINQYPDDSIPNKIMNDLKSNLLPINPPGCQFQILKVGDYRNNRKKYDALGLMPGDTIPKIIIPKPISISQIKYDNEDEFKNLKKLNEKLIRKNNIGIGELLFLNGKINFKPEFFKDPYRFVDEKLKCSNPFDKLIKEIRQMMDELAIHEHVENENNDNFNWFDDDDDEIVEPENKISDVEIDFDF